MERMPIIPALRTLAHIADTLGVECINSTALTEELTRAADEIERLSTPDEYFDSEDTESWYARSPGEALEEHADFNGTLQPGTPICAITRRCLPDRWLIALPTFRDPYGNPCEFLAGEFSTEETARAAYSAALLAITPARIPHLERFVEHVGPGEIPINEVGPAYRAWLAASETENRQQPILNLHECLGARGWVKDSNRLVYLPRIPVEG